MTTPSTPSTRRPMTELLELIATSDDRAVTQANAARAVDVLRAAEQPPTRESVCEQIRALVREHAVGAAERGEDPRLAAARLVRALSDDITAAVAVMAPYARTPCYPWCKPGCQDDNRLDPAEHEGERVRLPIPEAMASTVVDDILSAYLHDSDDYDGPPVISVNSGGNGQLLDADTVDDLAASLEGYAGQLRLLTQQARHGRPARTLNDGQDGGGRV